MWLCCTAATGLGMWSTSSIERASAARRLAGSTLIIITQRVGVRGAGLRVHFADHCHGLRGPDLRRGHAPWCGPWPRQAPDVIRTRQGRAIGTSKSTKLGSGPFIIQVHMRLSYFDNGWKLFKWSQGLPRPRLYIRYSYCTHGSRPCRLSRGRSRGTVVPRPRSALGTPPTRRRRRLRRPRDRLTAQVPLRPSRERGRCPAR